MGVHQNSTTCPHGISASFLVTRSNCVATGLPCLAVHYLPCCLERRRYHSISQSPITSCLWGAPPSQPTWRIARKHEAFSYGCSSLKPRLRQEARVGIHMDPAACTHSQPFAKVRLGCKSIPMVNAKLRGCCEVFKRSEKFRR